MMDFDLDDLKKKYRRKTRVDIVDLTALQTMVPLLIREICRLENELATHAKYIKALEKKKPPTEKTGKSGKAQWEIVYNMKKRRLAIKLKGVFDYKSAKQASNAIVSMLPNVEPGFDLINDIRELEAITDMRTVFHLRKARYHLVQAGVDRTVRVVGSKQTLITGLFEKFFKQGAKTMVTKTVEDAEQALENQGKFLAP